jgi:hypothetical protein
MNVRFGAFTLRVDCPTCGLPVPLNAPVEAARCRACATDFGVPLRVFGYMLMHFDDDPTSAAPYPEGAQPVIDGMQVHATAAREEAACGACHAPLALDALAPTAPTTLTCASCGANAVSYPAPAWLTVRVATARAIIVTDAGAVPAAERAASERAEGVDRPAAELADGAARPEAVTAPWFVRFEGESRATLAAAEGKLDALVRERAESARARSGCLTFLVGLAAVIALGITASIATRRHAPPPAASPATVGGEPAPAASPATVGGEPAPAASPATVGAEPAPEVPRAR